MHQKLPETYEFDVIAGVAVGGVPLAVAVSLASKKPYAIIRSSEKGHGKKDLIIGNVRGKNVLLIEDVTTSGGSALYGIEVLRAAGARADRVVTVVDREQGAGQMLLEHGVEIIPLVRVSELLKEQGFLGHTSNRWDNEDTRCGRGRTRTCDSCCPRPQYNRLRSIP